ncbi:hypothetical protein Val02_52290 [Virgisporangium aliadipatigenens]|uniref:AAA+ ATPase domain-containing protein n=1 Tax=Virgisporangium aliadipatigenens TaxID=741659 RepID=A0A8J4DSX8_9ACTN|nr:NB-ARC domain-containing protein [Virgisporangium aliadipatigenens]GIJ48343.1 hypothetical protein Val02_52290 [Virgisporangium aliadipatigenens]
MRRTIRPFAAVLAVAAAALTLTVWPDDWSAQARFLVLGGSMLVLVVLFDVWRRPRRPPWVGVGVPAGPAAGSVDGGWESGTVVTAGSPDPQWPEEPVGEVDVSSATFCGRGENVAEILGAYRIARERRADHRRRGEAGPVSDDTVGRPVVIAIHGKPGVGKSVLAKELARRLENDHPDGSHHANFGNAGDPLAAAEIIVNLLRQLDWHEKLSQDPADNLRTFRTLTAQRRALFIFDAARDHQQVLNALPAGSGCTVIVTSRLDLQAGLRTPSWRLDEPAMDDALDMFHTLAETSPYRDPVCTATIVESCGRLPLAIRSAAERMLHERAAPCSIAKSLDPPETRLERLTHRDRSPERVFETQYRHLEGDEQKAFHLLALVPSPTFLPWVLAPLLFDTRVGRAESIATRLAELQLLEVDDRRWADRPRYRMHPLVRLFAERKAGDDRPARYAQELSRLWEAYLWIVGAVVKEIDRTLPESALPQAPIRHEIGLRVAADIAQSRQRLRWVRAEHRTLVGCVEELHRARNWPLCWRVASWLGECYPHDGDLERDLNAVALGIQAADNDNNRIGRIDVRRAMGSLLIRAERYVPAGKHLMEALEQARAHPGLLTRLREGLIQLKLAEAYVQQEAPCEVTPRLRAARQIFGELGRTNELQLVRIIDDINNQVSSGAEFDPDGHADDQLGFWSAVAQAEERRRREQWREAADSLRGAVRRSEGDISREAFILYRLACLHLEQLNVVEDGDGSVVRAAVRRAAEARMLYRRMGNRPGELRARCVLARALVAAGEPVPAEEHIKYVADHLPELVGEAPSASGPIEARLAWARGDLLRARGGRQDDARSALLSASTKFEDLDDIQSQNAVRHAINAMDDPGVDRPSTALPRQRADTTNSAYAATAAGTDAASVVTLLRKTRDSTLPPSGWRVILAALDIVGPSPGPDEFGELRAVITSLSTEDDPVWKRRIGGSPGTVPPAGRNRFDELIARLAAAEHPSPGGPQREEH